MADEPTNPPPPPTPSGSAPEPGQGADTMAEAALAAAREAIAGLGDLNDLNKPAADEPAEARPTPAVSPLPLPSFAPAGGTANAKAIDLLGDVNLNVKIELGRTRMLVEDVLRLTDGAVVELDKLAGDPVDIYVNERHVARGEVLVLNDNFCVRISEIIAPTADAAKAG